MFERDLKSGITFIFFLAIVCVPLCCPYFIIEFFLAYCLKRRFGSVLGTALFFAIDPILFTLSSLLPFYFIRRCCTKRCCSLDRSFFNRMRLLRALEATFATNGLQMTILLRLSPIGSKPAQNYLLGSTRVDINDFVKGTILGCIPQMLLASYLAK